MTTHVPMHTAGQPRKVAMRRRADHWRDMATILGVAVVLAASSALWVVFHQFAASQAEVTDRVALIQRELRAAVCADQVATFERDQGTVRALAALSEDANPKARARIAVVIADIKARPAPTCRANGGG